MLIDVLKKINEQTPAETGFPGNPKKGIFLYFPNIRGFPGLIAIFQKSTLVLLFFLSNTLFNRSYLPTDAPPEETKRSQSKFLFKIFSISLVLSFAIGKIFGIPPKTLTIEEIIRLFPLGI